MTNPTANQQAIPVAAAAARNEGYLAGALAMRELCVEFLRERARSALTGSSFQTHNFVVLDQAAEALAGLKLPLAALPHSESVVKRKTKAPGRLKKETEGQQGSSRSSKG